MSDLNTKNMIEIWANIKKININKEYENNNNYVTKYEYTVIIEFDYMQQHYEKELQYNLRNTPLKIKENDKILGYFDETQNKFTPKNDLEIIKNASYSLIEVLFVMISILFTLFFCISTSFSKNSNNTSRITIATIFLIVFSVLYFKFFINKKGYIVLEGKIKDILFSKRISINSSDSYQYIIEFPYENSNTTFISNSAKSTYRALTRKVGDKIKVFYNPTEVRFQDEFSHNFSIKIFAFLMPFIALMLFSTIYISYYISK